MEKHFCLELNSGKQLGTGIAAEKQLASKL